MKIDKDVCRMIQVLKKDNKEISVKLEYKECFFIHFFKSKNVINFNDIKENDFIIANISNDFKKITSFVKVNNLVLC
jgi:hypothetical protein